MPFQVSPGVNVTEIDLTTVVPAVSTTEGAIAGVFRWGPVDKVVLVDSETSLVSRFGKPTNFNAETFFTAANFLAYGNKLFVVRAANTTGNSSVSAYNAIANTDSLDTADNIELYVVKNDDMIEDENVLANIENADDAGVVKFVARYPGDLGNSLKVSVCDSAAGFSKNVGLLDAANGAFNAYGVSANSAQTFFKAVTGANTITVQVNRGSAAIANAVAQADVIRDSFAPGDVITVGNSTIGTQRLKITEVNATSNTADIATFVVELQDTYKLSTFQSALPTLHANGDIASFNEFSYGTSSLTNTTGYYIPRSWEYSTLFDNAPGTSTYVGTYGAGNVSTVTDEVHVVIEDEDGKISGVPGTILEVFQGVSRASDAKTDDGATNYMKDVINQNSRFIYVGNDVKANTGFAYFFNAADANTAVQSNTNIVSIGATGSIVASAPVTLSFTQGTDGQNETDVSISTLIAGYDKFKSAEDIDVSLILQGKARGGDHGQQLANHLIDNIAEVRRDCVVFVSPDRADVVLNGAADEYSDIITFRNSITSTSYAVMDSGYKYQYDKYNDVYRYVPLNGDVAGLCVRTDDVRDPWFSPAGFNRGIIKNVVKLAYNPKKADRDQLYKAGINPVVTFPGQGTILFGDKTLLAKPSAFDRINVRRLFIVLEKAIATAAKFTLFEFNDEFTRAQFKNLVEPFLRDVQGRRGIFDFRVVCDETNNTGEVIDRNEFVGDIYIKPAKSINFIQLNFVAVRSGVEFSEVVGRF